MANKNDDGKRIKTISCSFCGKRQDQVRRLFSGMDNNFICDECVNLCGEILDEEDYYDEEDHLGQEDNLEINLLKPTEIKKFLDGIQIKK